MVVSWPDQVFRSVAEQDSTMPRKAPEPGVKNGLEFETTFYSNPRKDSAFRFRATHIDGRPASRGLLVPDL